MSMCLFGVAQAFLKMNAAVEFHSPYADDEPH